MYSDYSLSLVGDLATFLAWTVALVSLIKSFIVPWLIQTAFRWIHRQGLCYSDL